MDQKEEKEEELQNIILFKKIENKNLEEKEKEEKEEKEKEEKEKEEKEEEEEEEERISIENINENFSDLLQQRQPITLAFSNIQLSIQKKLNSYLEKITNNNENNNLINLPILQNINGIAKPGRILAILGGSGAGKSSLLNVLAGRIYDGIIDGNIYLNNENITGEKKNFKKMKRIVGYVPQEEHLLANLTVKETLTIAAMMRLPDIFTKEQKLQQVQNVIEELRLSLCVNTKIGNELIRGISGGEKKRVSIGIHLLTNPSILFLDEPTSGLDSTMSYNIVHLLKKIAKKIELLFVQSISQVQIFLIFLMT
jgi:ABC-type multidrug transport system ATPase subunit